MPPELFYDAFFFFNRHEAENLRTVCRAFDALCTGLRDVHGYKLLIDNVVMRRRVSAVEFRHVLSVKPEHCFGAPHEPDEYSATVEAYDRLLEIKGSEGELAAGLKAALAVSLVHEVYIFTSALAESLYSEPAEFFSGVWTENLVLQAETSTYGETVISSKLQ
ncbi:hypothetical protein AAVH_33073, partial [Aphelenchoides avenae]